MADTEDFLAVYRRFFEEFATTVNPNDQLPVKVAGYYLYDSEIVGEIVDWTLQYLNLKHCPSSLVAPLTRIVIDEIKLACKKQPAACGYRSAEKTYQPLKLMQVVTGKVNEVCLRYRDNGKLATLPPPSLGPPISSCAIKNSRRCMEDRHVIIEDFHTVFGIQDCSPTSYYAVFDGHAGTDAAVYSVSHLHQFLAESSFYPTDPERALRDAFSRTDSLFLEKCNRENLRSGTTAVCALLRPTEQMLYVAWLGDSQALLVRNGQGMQVVNPHKPDRKDERERIEDMGGCVLFWGTWRVNGELAVSRAIGDLGYKPYVTSEPDVTAVPLNGTEDFLVLACDGLWDFVSEQEAVMAVYQQIAEAPGDIEYVSQRLVQLSKLHGSTDNISVIVVFLTEPAQLASRPIPQWANNGPPPQEACAMETNSDHNSSSSSAGNNPFLACSASDSVPYQKVGLLLDLGVGGDDGQMYRHNGTSPSSTDQYFLDRPKNGNNTAGVDNYEDDDDDDFGPETDVDAVDDVLLSPAGAKSETLNNNPFGSGDEKKTLEADLELQRQQLSDFDPVREPREETPTPPADEVPAVTTVPEPDNVAESGEDSEDEWNYYRVEPSSEGNQEASQPVHQKPVEPQLEDELNMESQLNPDAAEFVPSPTQMMPSMEEVFLAQSPSKGIIMEDISVPSQSEFQREVSRRPSELDLASEAPVSPENKKPSKLPDLITTEEGDNVNPFVSSPYQLENREVFSNILEKEQKSEIFREQQNIDMQELTLDESEVTSTKEEFGDDSTGSLIIASELQKTVTECTSSLSALEKSFADLDFQETEFMPYVAKSDNNSTCDDNELSRINENEVYMNKSKVEETALHEEGSMVLENIVPTCFEVQKESVPEVELKLERVELESEDTSSLDDSGSPLQVEGNQLEEVEESAILSQGPDLPVSSPVRNPPFPEEQAVTSQIQEPSLQDLVATDILSSPAEHPVSSAEKEIFSPEQFSTPMPQSSLCGSASPVPTSAPELVSPLVDMWSKPSMLQGQESPRPPCHFEPCLNLPPASDALSMLDLVEREEDHIMCSEILRTPGSLDPFGNIQSSFEITDPKHDHSVVPSSVLEQHPLLRNEDNEKSPAYDMEPSGIVGANEDGNQKTFPVEPPIHQVKAEAEECVVRQTPPPTPEHVSGETPQLSSVEPPPAHAEPFEVSEKVVDTVNEGSSVATVAVGTAVATAVLAGVAVAHEKKPAEEIKAPERNLSKKPTTADKKETIAVKTKLAKMPVSNKTPSPPTGTARILQKSKPFSPAKPPSTTLRSSTPNKSISSGPFPASKATKSTVIANKPKPGATSPTKPLPSALKSAGVSPRIQTGATATKSATVSNGDVAKPAVLKKTSASTAARPQSRPATAPATTKTGTAKQMGTVTSRTNPVSTVSPQLKSGTVNVGASKTRSAGTVATGTSCNKVGTASDAKLVANRQKQMSTTRAVSNRTVTVAAHSAAAPAARRVVAGVTKTTVISSTGKVGPKKTTSSMPNSGTRASTTASTKTTKTEVTVTSVAAENNE